MGRFAEKAKKIKQKDEGNFKPLDLTEGNVQAIFNRCLATKDSSSALRSDLFPAGLGYLDIGKRHAFEFDKEIILKNKSSLKYLFGQLASVHTPKKILTVEDFLKNYLGQNWTSEKATLMQLLYLGNCPKIDLIFPFNAKQNNTTHFVSSIKPTLSPKDPNFPAWWEEHKSEWEAPKKEGQSREDD